MPNTDIVARVIQLEQEIAAMRAGMGDLTDLSSAQEEALRKLDTSRQQIDEDVRSALRAFDTLQDEVDRMTDRLHTSVGRKLEQERTRFSAWSNNVAGTFGEALRNSTNRSLVGSVTDGTTGVGRAGMQLGGIIGSAAGGALGAFFGGPVGAQLGQQLGGQIMGTITREFETLMSGPRVMGARLAPIITGGRPTGNESFEKMGLTFMNQVRRISQLLNVSADDVLRYAGPLAQVGVGWREAGQTESMYAMATERVLALQPGTVLRMQTEMVSRYGEGLKGVRDVMNQVRAGQREFNALNMETGSSVLRSISAGQTYIDMLTQISAGASNSGASVRALTEVAGAMVKTMATSQGGRPGMRPGQMGEVARSTISALLPQMSQSWNEEARRSGVSRMLVDATGYGREYARRVEAAAPESLRGHPGMTFQMAERDYLLRRKKYGMQGVLAKMSGIYAAYKPGRNLLAAGRLGEELGMTPAGTGVVVDLMKDFERQHGFNINRFSPNSEGMFRKFMREKQHDPAYRARLQEMGAFKPVMDAALEQGRGSKTAMDKIADSLDSIRGNLTSYWQQWKQATAEVFGLQPGSTAATVAAAAGALMTPAGSFGAAASVVGAVREQAALRAEAAPSVTTKTTVIGKSTARAMDYEVSTRDSNVLPR